MQEVDLKLQFNHCPGNLVEYSKLEKKFFVTSAIADFRLVRFYIYDSFVDWSTGNSDDSFPILSPTICQRYSQISDSDFRLIFTTVFYLLISLSPSSYFDSIRSIQMNFINFDDKNETYVAMIEILNDAMVIEMKSKVY